MSSLNSKGGVEMGSAGSQPWELGKFLPPLLPPGKWQEQSLGLVVVRTRPHGMGLPRREPGPREGPHYTTLGF